MQPDISATYIEVSGKTRRHQLVEWLRSVYGWAFPQTRVTVAIQIWKRILPHRRSWRSRFCDSCGDLQRGVRLFHGTFVGCERTICRSWEKKRRRCGLSYYQTPRRESERKARIPVWWKISDISWEASLWRRKTDENRCFKPKHIRKEARRSRQT